MTKIPSEGKALLPCPFCGDEAERYDDHDTGSFNEGGSCIQCKGCRASSPMHFDRKENLISSWNTRAAPVAQCDARSVDAVREALEQFREYTEQWKHHDSITGHINLRLIRDALAKVDAILSTTEQEAERLRASLTHPTQMVGREIKWLVTLARMGLENARQERLRAGHDFGTKKIGLYDNEVDDFERAADAILSTTVQGRDAVFDQLDEFAKQTAPFGYVGDNDAIRKFLAAARTAHCSTVSGDGK